MPQHTPRHSSDTTRVLRLVQQQDVPGPRGFASPASRVATPVEGSPETLAPLLLLVIARVCDQTGTPRSSVAVERHEGGRFRVTAPQAFLARLLEQPEVALAEDVARDPLAL
jgi:hypothetical protein